MKLIQRKQYLQNLMDVMGTPDIKVITGVRRSGKSKLMTALIQQLLDNDPRCNIIHINFNLLEYESLKEYHALYNYIEGQWKEGVSNILLIDEVQMCEGFEKSINSLNASEKYDIFITGSNAFLLSSDLATLFTGRTYEVKVYPFSFQEYQEYFNGTNIDESFDNYMLEGGMAGSYLYKNRKDKYQYLNDDVFNALVVRDIETKYNVRNKTLLYSLIDYMMDNVGNLTSVRNIANMIPTGKGNENDKTVGTYIEYLTKAFAFYRIRRYDIKGKKYLNTEDKFYLSDHAFRYARLGTKNMDYGHVMENIVAIELLRRGYEIYVGVLYKKEIDFVAMTQNEKIYIQVSDDISRAETFEREVIPLLKINDAYPKMIIARTRHDEYQYEGVVIVDISRWLLNLRLVPITQK
ncbi:MAG: ATP-binding protein [Paludibacteraceae bacterium]|nr:ATP-binding protein [Paludibacteraceae bacterium]